MKSLPLLGLTKEIWVLDIESRSNVDIKKRGQHIYWSDPSSRVLMTSVRLLGDRTGPTYLWDFEARQDAYPDWFTRKLAAPPDEVMFAAANCEFDRQGLVTQGFDTPDNKWLDILVLAYILGFAGRLEDILKRVFTNVQKDPEGTRLITLFSTPPHAAWYEEPEKWETFRTYCIHDTEVETKLLEWCLKHLNQSWFQPVVREIYKQELIYRRINRRGIPVDLPAVNGARAVRDTAIDTIMNEMKEKTGLENPNSRDQLLSWLKERNYPQSDLTKESVQSVLTDQNTSEEIREVLSLREESGKTSNKKYDALAQATDTEDWRFRGGWQFYGASRTGRIAGRVLNPANLTRPKTKYPEIVAEFMQFGNMELLTTLFPEEPVLNTLSSSIRASLKAPSGQLWCVADIISIESVGSAWLSGCKTILDIFHRGRDTYKTFASKVLNKPYEEITKEERTLFKPVVLGGAYGLSAIGLTKYASGMGIHIDLPEAEKQISAFREEYHELIHYWHQLTYAAISAVKNPNRPFHAYAVSKVLAEYGDDDRIQRIYEYARWPKVTFQYDGECFLYCRLPSGRLLCYFKPRIDPNFEITMPDGHSFVKETVLYYGIDQKATGSIWREISSYGPKWLENITQAVCRDVLWFGLKQAEKDERLEVVGDVYDEILSLCDENDKNALQRLAGYMTARPAWLTDSFFLGADGYTSKRYKKD